MLKGRRQKLCPLSKTTIFAELSVNWLYRRIEFFTGIKTPNPAHKGTSEQRTQIA